jgi:hypothetical protein
MWVREMEFSRVKAMDGVRVLEDVAAELRALQEEPNRALIMGGWDRMADAVEGLATELSAAILLDKRANTRERVRRNGETSVPTPHLDQGKSHG